MYRKKPSTTFGSPPPKSEDHSRNTIARSNAGRAHRRTTANASSGDTAAGGAGIPSGAAFSSSSYLFVKRPMVRAPMLTTWRTAGAVSRTRATS